MRFLDRTYSLEKWPKRLARALEIRIRRKPQNSSLRIDAQVWLTLLGHYNFGLLYNVELPSLLACFANKTAGESLNKGSK